MTRRSRRTLPSIVMDEHVPPSVTAAFRPLFRTQEAAKHPRLRGRDETDYLSELYARNAIFVTSDVAFVNALANTTRRHAGVLYIPHELLDDEKVLFAQIAGGYIQGACSTSSTALRGRILYPGDDGLRSVLRSKDDLEFSWDWLRNQSEATTPSRVAPRGRRRRRRPT